MQPVKACPRCSSTETHFRKNRGDWVCDDCDHRWVDEDPPAADMVADAAPLGLAVFITASRSSVCHSDRAHG